MLQFVKQKIKNKKGLNLCLMAGIALLVAMFSCHPMFERGAANQLLRMAFLDYAEENREFPVVFSRSGTYETKDYKTVSAVLKRLDSYVNKWTEYVDVDRVSLQQFMKLSGNTGVSELGSKKRFLSIGYMRDLEEHVSIVRGMQIADAKAQNVYPEAIPCILSESVMDSYGMVVGEHLVFPYSSNPQDGSYTLVVAGIFREKEDDGNFWYHGVEHYEKTVFVAEEDFDALIAAGGDQTTVITYEQNLLLDYTQFHCDNVDRYRGYIAEFEKADHFFYNNVSGTLQKYAARQKSAKTILWVLELPCIVLLLLFIYMVSSQILSAEEGEIAVLRSRGVTKRQTIALYMLQSGILSAAGLVLGVGLGYLLCKFAASTDSFLQFSVKDIHLYAFTWQMFLYAGAACVIAMLFMTIPVWRRAGITIVQQKGLQKYTGGSPFWEKFFLDAGLLLVSLYLLYNYNKQSMNLSFSVMDGDSLDPMVFLDASLFIFSCGLVFLRLSRYLVLLINRIGKKHWSPAMYASFLQIQRTFKKQGFISIFLIMTIANGIFNANMARTMNENNEQRIAYDVGCDMIFKEKWKMNITKGSDETMYWSYEAPNDYETYRELVAQGVCESVTRVITDTNTKITYKGKKLEGCTLMGIHTKEFGETARLKDGLNETHWFYALNALSQMPDGVIISRNLAEDTGLEVGDTLNYSRYHPTAAKAKEEIAVVSGTVCAIIDAFPGYAGYTYGKDKEGNTVEEEKYLIVANYASVVSQFGLTPYHVWVRFADGAGSAPFLSALLEKQIAVEQYVALDEQIVKSRGSAMIQITNGMFTLSFLISLVICSVGFLIYWIMSIKNRELLFGIYRAMGMQMKEIRLMLINEQIFSSVLSIAAGGGVGAIGTMLFVRLIALVYLPEKHNIPIQIYVYASDIIKLFAVVFVMVIVCVIVLRRLLQNMNIAQALKLGED